CTLISSSYISNRPLLLPSSFPYTTLFRSRAAGCEIPNQRTQFRIGGVDSLVFANRCPRQQRCLMTAKGLEQFSVLSFEFAEEFTLCLVSSRVHHVVRIGA